VEDKRTVTLYETLFVVHPEKGPRIKEFVEKFNKVIEGQDGSVLQVDEWGLRELAYRIDKQGKGIYILVRYRSTGRAVDELERNLRLTDGILRYLTVRAQEGSPAASPSASRTHTEEQNRPPHEEPAKADTQS
jgi:small subunit ribosomal protein S6